MAVQRSLRPVTPLGYKAHRCRELSSYSPAPTCQFFKEILVLLVNFTASASYGWGLSSRGELRHSAASCGG